MKCNKMFKGKLLRKVLKVIVNCLESIYFPEATLQGCCTKSKQKPRFEISRSSAAIAALASVESVCTTILNGLRKPKNGYELNPSIV